jgi:hypothetical protein
MAGVFKIKPQGIDNILTLLKFRMWTAMFPVEASCKSNAPISGMSRRNARKFRWRAVDIEYAVDSVPVSQALDLSGIEGLTEKRAREAGVLFRAPATPKQPARLAVGTHGFDRETRKPVAGHAFRMNLVPRGRRGMTATESRSFNNRNPGSIPRKSGDAGRRGNYRLHYTPSGGLKVGVNRKPGTLKASVHMIEPEIVGKKVVAYVIADAKNTNGKPYAWYVEHGFNRWGRTKGKGVGFMRRGLMAHAADITSGRFLARG